MYLHTFGNMHIIDFEHLVKVKSMHRTHSHNANNSNNNKKVNKNGNFKQSAGYLPGNSIDNGWQMGNLQNV